MSKPLTLIQKIRMFRKYLKEQKDGVVVDCAYCHSVDIKFNEQVEHKIDGNQTTYSSKYTCNNCGATCRNKQEWFTAQNS